MSSWCVKLPFEVLFHSHPSVFEINVVAPGANPRETLEVVNALYHSARRTHYNEPNRKDEQHLQCGRAKIRNVRVVPKDQCTQVDEFIEPGQANDRQESNALNPQHARNRSLLLHLTSNGIRRADPVAEGAPCFVDGQTVVFSQ